VIVQPIELGGLKMISISDMIKASKIMWIRRLLNNIDAKWKKLSWKLLGITMKQLFSKLNISYISKGINVKFYKQILDIWYNFISFVPKNHDEIIHEKIFNNRFILSDSKPLDNTGFLTGLPDELKILDLFNINGITFLSQEALNIKFHTNLHFLNYNRLIHSIPQNWKNILSVKDKKAQSRIKFQILEIKNIAHLTNKLVYNLYIEEKYENPKSQDKWIANYPILEAAEWEKIYKMPFFYCRETFLQSLQYKILHRILNCNYNLYKWGIKDTPKCDHCDSVDTLEHFLFECYKVNMFWKSIQKWLYGITGISINFTLLEVIFGFMSDDDYCFCRNFVIFYAKKFIYDKKQIGEFFFIEFLSQLKKTLLIERKIHIIKDTEYIFNKRLGNILESL